MTQDNSQSWDRGFGLLDGRYMIAMNPQYGNVGDKITAVYRDPNTGKEQKIPMIMSDSKDPRDDNAYSGCGVAGHLNGTSLSIIEFEVLNGKTNPGTDGYRPKDINGEEVDIRGGKHNGMRLVQVINEGPSGIL